MRYHFHMRDSAGLIRCAEGENFRSGAPARRIEIADEGGTVLESVGVAVTVN